ncbi:(2Fe-2S)-binding protein [Sneathiella sp.]|uniref:(2Fe-2S)-binding protein n=1 Tax=Sneathiella sp. TaxID=1964365 RepID=UPI003563599C
MPTAEYIQNITLSVNGESYTSQAEPRTSLADFLRYNLELTGTHIGCEHGVCGACTVLIDGNSMRSCLMFAVQAEGKEIATVEGLAEGNQLNSLQKAFWERHGLQCGFCTSGILMTLTEYFEINSEYSEKTIRDVLSGHICRCTGYESIVAAALDVANSKEAGNE